MSSSDAISREGLIGLIPVLAGQLAADLLLKNKKRGPLGRPRAHSPRSSPGDAPKSAHALERERNGFAPLRRVDDAHIDALAFGQMRDAGRPEDRNMHEDVLAAVVARHEPEALGVIEPFDLAGDADRRRRIGRDAARARRAERRRGRAQAGEERMRKRSEREQA